MSTASRRRRRIAVLVVLACAGVGSSGCREPAPAGSSCLPLLSAGHFVDSGEWIDFRQTHAETTAHRGILPPSRLATVAGDWGGEESWGAWGTGGRTLLHFFLRWRGARQLVVRCRSAEHPDGRPQSVTVRINDREIGSFEAGSDWQTHRLEIPPEILGLGDHRVELLYAWHLDGDPAVDPRPRALAFEAVGLLAPGQRPPRPGDEPALELDADADALTLRRSGTLLAPLSVPEHALALELSGTARGEDARWRAGLMTLDGHEPEPALGEDGRGRLDLAAHRGRELFLVVDLDLPRGGSLELRYPRLVTETAETATPPIATTPSRPDVVLVVLDAARADRFSAYGEARDVTPHLDRLARESLVFESATAECPYTTCSMPNLLAGLTFTQHGVISRGQRLAQDARTLAGELAELGYRTLAWTANPNSSPATGATQGFDEVHEIWRLAEGRDRTHPGLLTDLAIERLTALDERPFFALLHYVPPHEPYDPDPRFDVFGDPAYAGPVTGEQRFVQSVFTGEVELDDADLAELSALYDGNLKMADHAVGRLIEALRAAGRFDDAVFVLTSDHGEAFDEHGFLGHNETLYEEMLRVPLIVRLPGGARPEGVDTAHLASLGDLLPSVLGHLGRAVPSQVRGVDLLHPGSGNPRDRLVWLRSSHEAGTIFGVRTPRFKLMARQSASWAAGWFRLYDLVDDPGETTDLAAERRLLQVALAWRLERALEAGAAPEAAGELDIPEADREMLQSLGYL